MKDEQLENLNLALAEMDAYLKPKQTSFATPTMGGKKAFSAKKMARRIQISTLWHTKTKKSRKPTACGCYVPVDPASRFKDSDVGLPYSYSTHFYWWRPVEGFQRPIDVLHAHAHALSGPNHDRTFANTLLKLATAQCVNGKEVTLQAYKDCSVAWKLNQSYTKATQVNSDWEAQAPLARQELLDMIAKLS